MASNNKTTFKPNAQRPVVVVEKLNYHYSSAANARWNNIVLQK